MNPFNTLVEALEALADDHEHGATGTVRQDHLHAARTALAEAKRWEAVEGSTYDTGNGPDFFPEPPQLGTSERPALLLIQKEASHD